MNKEYNSRQRKIYRDYNEYSSDDLFEIVKNSNKYIPEVIEVINGILIERKLILPSAEKETEYNETGNFYGAVNSEQDELLDKEKRKNDEVLKSFVKKLKEKSDNDLSDIIRRYISYEPMTVEAALFISVERGIISYDLKELLLKQIETNFTAHSKRIKQNKWETNNAFIPYVSRYQDDEIYKIIEDPSDIVIDVYHAILVTARERELISDADLAGYYKEAKAAIRTEHEIIKDEIDKYFQTDDPANDFENEAEIEAEKEKYWKCPSCNQLVEMEFGVCWNCQTEIPETVEHPDTEEIIKEQTAKKTFNPIKSGFILIGTGILVGLLGLVRTYHSHFRIGRLAFGAFIILIGIVFIISGLFFKSKLKRSTDS